ncbi:MAG: four helix bundle suffix domain-containing protein [Muribaculaceae bacterium]
MGGFLRTKGGYRNLRVYRLSEIIYDLSMIFAKQYVRTGSRTRDQIEQAARSGKQNIAEGSTAATTSRETEIKLTNVAKASLEELLLDYEDYLRQNDLPKWDKNHPRTLKLREYLKSQDFLDNPTKFASKMNVEEFCNMCITLINQATYMLRRLIDRQQEQFLQEGGVKEQMYAARVEYRKRETERAAMSDESDKSDGSDGR